MFLIYVLIVYYIINRFQLFELNYRSNYIGTLTILLNKIIYIDESVVCSCPGRISTQFGISSKFYTNIPPRMIACFMDGLIISNFFYL